MLFNNQIPIIGEESIILHDDNTFACKIKITKVIISEFKNITKEEAHLEGEGQDKIMNLKSELSKALILKDLNAFATQKTIFVI